MTGTKPDPRPDLTAAEQQELRSTIRASQRAQKRAEHARALALIAPTPCGPDGEDHGMDLGPAALARTRTLARVDGKLRGAGQRQADPVYAVRLDAETLFERMNNAGQLSDRQCRAGLKLLLLSRMAGLDARVTARLPVTPTPDDDDEEADEVEALVPEGYDARTWHRWLLRQLSGHGAALVEAACRWTPENRIGHPGVRFLATFQVMLDKVADLLRLPQE